MGPFTQEPWGTHWELKMPVFNDTSVSFSIPFGTPDMVPAAGQTPEVPCCMGLALQGMREYKSLALQVVNLSEDTRGYVELP